jgi:hypothetical protein
MQTLVSNRFLSRLHVEPLPGGRARLTAPLHYVTTDGELIVVPRGFETDYASVPALARFGVITAVSGQLCAIWHPWAYLLEAFALWVCFVSEWLENRDSDEAAVVRLLRRRARGWRQRGGARRCALGERPPGAP